MKNILHLLIALVTVLSSMQSFGIGPKEYIPGTDFIADDFMPMADDATNIFLTAERREESRIRLQAAIKRLPPSEKIHVLDFVIGKLNFEQWSVREFNQNNVGRIGAVALVIGLYVLQDAIVTKNDDESRKKANKPLLKANGLLTVATVTLLLSSFGFLIYGKLKKEQVEKYISKLNESLVILRESLINSQKVEKLLD